MFTMSKKNVFNYKERINRNPNRKEQIFNNDFNDIPGINNSKIILYFNNKDIGTFVVVHNLYLISKNNNQSQIGIKIGRIWKIF